MRRPPTFLSSDLALLQWFTAEEKGQQPKQHYSEMQTQHIVFWGGNRDSAGVPDSSFFQRYCHR